MKNYPDMKETDQNFEYKNPYTHNLIVVMRQPYNAYKAGK
jgi:hypothetical protein